MLVAPRVPSMTLNDATNVLLCGRGFGEISLLKQLRQLRYFYCQNAIKHALGSTRVQEKRRVWCSRSVWVFLKETSNFMARIAYFTLDQRGTIFLRIRWNAACRTNTIKLIRSFLCVRFPGRQRKSHRQLALGVCDFNKPETFTHSARMEEMPAR